MELSIPRLMVAAMRGGAGKTVVSVGLTAAWRRRLGLGITTFKKGPDYIDSGWLGAASGRPCYNLDPFLMSPEQMLRSFAARSARGNGAIIEANRGLYDGVDANGSYSSAALAKLLRCPVVLVVDATKVTHTAAAMVLGCRMMDPGVNLAAVILNQVAGKRHEAVLRESIEKHCEVPVLGVVPRQNLNFFPERHLGLVPPDESEDIPGAVELAAEKMGEYLDIEALWKLAAASPVLDRVPDQDAVRSPAARRAVRIGVIRDSAFQFYYPENLEALEARGALLVRISSLEAGPLPEVDALYIGGGFPETHLEALSANVVFRKSVKAAAEAGLPVYAECGGLMFLCRGIRHHERFHPMAGVFPFEIVLGTKPQGHGYTIMECVGPNPFFPEGTIMRGHEFHYSGIAGEIDPALFPFVFRLEKGHGISPGRDGICYRNVLACYSHLHAVGNELWADALVAAAESYKRTKTKTSADCGQDRVQPESQSFPAVY